MEDSVTTGRTAAAPAEAAGENWAEGRLVLPGGVARPDGKRAKVAYVRQLTGREEEILGDRRYRSGARQATDFLAAVIDRIEGLDPPVTQDLVADMLIGDRDYLLLRLRQMNAGDVVEQVLRCPARNCGQKADVEFAISEIPVRRADAVEERYELQLSEPALTGDQTSRRIVFRLPSGRDQEAIEGLKDANPAAANTRLFSRVILECGRAGQPDEETVRAFSLKARREINAFLCGVCPGPDLTVDIQCPHCGADMTYPFDLYSFFFSEWSAGLDQLYEEVHHLAFHYHWSEREILAMPLTKRRRYLSRLVRTLEQAQEARSGV